MIDRIEHRGPLVTECSLPGETRADGVFPSHPNGIQLSKNRFLILFGTRGYRGADDNLSIVYQVRADSYDGPVLSENFVIRSIDDWDPFGDGHRYVRQHGHPVAFGVPKGARIDTEVPPHANLFAIKWRRVARQLDPDDPSRMMIFDGHPELTRHTQGVEWMQVRLNDTDDDLEVVEPPKALRQKGFDAGARLCSADVRAMNQSYTQPVPFNHDASEWADVNHFDQKSHQEGRPKIAALKYRFNPTLGRYEWIETGPAIDDDLFESSLVAREGGRWIIASRTGEGGRRAGTFQQGKAGVRPGRIAWMAVDDLFADTPDRIRPERPMNNSPLTAFRFADGVVRLLTGDPDESPYHNPRNPLYLWEIDPDDGFRAVRHWTVLDTIEAGIPIPLEELPKAELGKLLPHSGGSKQILLHGVYPRSVNDPSLTGSAVSEEAMSQTGIFYAEIRYSEDQPGGWTFAEASS